MASSGTTLCSQQPALILLPTRIPEKVGVPQRNVNNIPIRNMELVYYNTTIQSAFNRK